MGEEMGILSHIPSVVKRWLAFNFVGAMGILVQIGMLWGSPPALHLRYLIATALAVEAAVLHNFFWHERWTWADRVARHNAGVFSGFFVFPSHKRNPVHCGQSNPDDVVGRKVRLPLSCTQMLSPSRYVPFLNFILGDRLVFRSGGTASQKEDTTMPQ